MKVQVRFLSIAFTAMLMVASHAWGQKINSAPPQRPQVVEDSGLPFVPVASAQEFSAPTVAGMLQDNQGFIWMASQYGLYRFDGYKFKVFVNDPDDPTSLGGVYIYSLFKDQAGTLWVGSDHSLDEFQPATESFSHRLVLRHSQNEQVSPIVNITQDHSGMMWLATRTGLYRFDPLTGAQKRYIHDSLNPRSLSSSDIKATLEDRDGDFWVATSKGVDELNRATGEITLHLALHEDHEVFLHQDRFGVFWVTHSSGLGLAILDKTASTLTPISLRQGSAPLKGLNGMGGVLEDTEGTIWVGSSHQGLLKFDREHGTFHRYRLESNVPNNHIGSTLSSLLQDRDGNIWGTFERWGPSLFRTKRPKFEALPYMSDEQLGEGWSLIDSLFTDSQGNLWVGTDGGLKKYAHAAGRLLPMPIRELASLTHVITTAQDRSGDIWFGTWHKGLTRFDPRTGRTHTYRHSDRDESTLSDDTVTGLLVDHRGALWVATWNGLNRFDPVTGRFIKYSPRQDEGAPIFWKLAEDARGTIWIGTGHSGLYRFDPDSGTFLRYHHIEGSSHSLSNDRVNSVFIDHRGYVWMPTQNGLDMLDPASGLITTYYERDGLAGNAASCILEGNHGTLWVGTNKGISSFDPGIRSFKTYTTADGLPGNDMTGWSTCSRSPEGEFAFGGFSGGVTFRPDELEEELSSPPVVLTDLMLEGREASIGRGSPLKKSITHSDLLIIPPTFKNFSLEFSALSYVNPLETRYRYKLDGLDQGWNEVGSAQRVVTYTSLPAGTFHFRVQAALRAGNWGEQGVDLRILVLPPWWRTWWFRLTCCGVAVLLMFFFYWYRMHQLDAQYRVRFEERLGERVRIARELHDTLLQGFQGLMLRFHVATQGIPPTEESRQIMEDALDRADTLLNESRIRIRGLRPETIANTPLTDALTVAAEALQLEKPLDLRITLTGAARKLNPTIKDEIYLIGKEALTNAFHHSHGSYIRIELSYGQKIFSFRLRDNGVGIPIEVLSAGRRSGHWGICGMRERAKIIGGFLEVGSCTGSGTQVELSLPANVAYEEPPRITFWNDLRTYFTRSRKVRYD